jgi:hypothetical protein
MGFRGSGDRSSYHVDDDDDDMSKLLKNLRMVEPSFK